jgi:hypothetical protein
MVAISVLPNRFVHARKTDDKTVAPADRCAAIFAGRARASPPLEAERCAHADSLRPPPRLRGSAWH